MKYVLIFLLLICCTSLFSQKYKYIIKFSDAAEEDMQKELSKKLYLIFDQSAEFEVLTSQFTVLSNVDISEVTFLQKMEEAGYTRIVFTKQEIINTITE